MGPGLHRFRSDCLLEKGQPDDDLLLGVIVVTEEKSLPTTDIALVFLSTLFFN